jgi:hypothetical protein
VRLCAFVLQGHETLLIAASDAASTQPSTTFLTQLGFIAIIVCIVCRKNAIGGWLLYFYWGAFAGNVMTTFYVLSGIKSYLPGTWHNPSLYWWFLASTLPGLAAEVCLLVAAIALLRIRTWPWVVRIRWILVAGILAGLIAVSIDAKFFPNSLFSDVRSLVFPSIFLPYMFLSTRVRRVFLTKDWDSGTPSATFADLRPRPGIIYTESELEAMREREHPNDQASSEVPAPPRDTLRI